VGAALAAATERHSASTSAAVRLDVGSDAAVAAALDSAEAAAAEANAAAAGAAATGEC
jgi:hypothetical protein